MRSLLGISLIVLCLTVSAQSYVVPFGSVGYGTYLQRRGISSEVGFQIDTKSKLDYSLSYKYFSGEINQEFANDKVKSHGLILWLNYTILKKERYDLRIGTGVMFYKFKLDDARTDFFGFDRSKNYKSFGLGIGSIEYRRFLRNDWILGLKYMITPEDGDAIEAVTFTIGKKLTLEKK